jgi:hypothetical protein
MISADLSPLPGGAKLLPQQRGASITKIRDQCPELHKRVGDTGIEPVTSSVSSSRKTAADGRVGGQTWCSRPLWAGAVWSVAVLLCCTRPQPARANAESQSVYLLRRVLLTLQSVATGEGAQPQDWDPSTNDLDPEPLGRLERSGASTLGFLATGVGAWAVFATENQAGSAVLILVGAAFLLMGIQGTPLIRLGAGENSLELERRRKQRRVAVAVRAADSNAEIEAIVEGTAILDPSVANSSYFQASVYEARIALACRTLGTWVDRQDVYDTGIDFSVGWNFDDSPGRLPRARTTVDVVLKFRGDGRKLRLEELPRLEGYPERRFIREEYVVGLVAVTNAALSPALERYCTENADRPLEVVRWRTEEDNPALANALKRAAREAPTDGPN